MNGAYWFLFGFVICLALAAAFDHYILHVKRKDLIADFEAWKTNAAAWFKAELAKAKTELHSLVPGGNAAPGANSRQAGASTVHKPRNHRSKK